MLTKFFTGVTLSLPNSAINLTIALPTITPEEDAQLERAVALSGLTKQDYIIRRLQCRDVVVHGNPRVYKALRNQLAAVLDELRRIAIGESVSADLLEVIKMITVTMDGLKEAQR